MSDGSPKLIAIDEQPNVLIVGNLFAFDRIPVIRPSFSQPVDLAEQYWLLSYNALMGVSAA
jgi:hypothetical protein